MNGEGNAIKPDQSIILSFTIKIFDVLSIKLGQLFFQLFLVCDLRILLHPSLHPSLSSGQKLSKLLLK